MEPLWTVLFFVSMFFNLRACFKLLVDWKGMLTTCRFVSDAYERLRALPDETALEADERAPMFLLLVPAYQEPADLPACRLEGLPPWVVVPSYPFTSGSVCSR